MFFIVQYWEWSIAETNTKQGVMHVFSLVARKYQRKRLLNELTFWIKSSSQGELLVSALTPHLYFLTEKLLVINHFAPSSTRGKTKMKTTHHLNMFKNNVVISKYIKNATEILPYNMPWCIFINKCVWNN